MELPEKNHNIEQNNSKWNVVVFILLFLSIISIAFFVYLKNQNINIKDVSLKEIISNVFLPKGKYVIEKAKSEFKYDSKESSVFSANKDYIIKCNKDSIKWLDQKGVEIFSKTVSLTKPLIKKAGSYILIADIGERDIYVISGKDIKWAQKIDGKIINADINENGYVTVVKSLKGYKGAVEAYDAEGNWIFITARADRFVLSAKVVPLGNKVFINSVDASGINANSNLEITDLRGEPLTNMVKNNMIFPSTWVFSDSSLLAVNDSMIVCYDTSNGTEKWKQNFNKIYSSGVSSGKYAVIAAESEEKLGILNKPKTKIMIYNVKGKHMAECSLDAEVINIEIYGDLIAVNTGRDIYFINTKGKLLGKYSSKIDIIGVAFFSRQEAAVISNSSVAIVKSN